MSSIAFIGLGNMGGPMAKNLMSAGHSLRVFDLSSEAMAEFAALGAHCASSAKDAVQGVDAVITMLPAGKHVKACYLGDEGLLACLPQGALALDTSTIDAETAREVGSAATLAGVEFMDSPVSGGTAAAAAATLAFMCGGSEQGFQRARPILEGMGNAEKIFHAGPAGAGQVAKAANNMLLAVHMIGTCEALSMGAAHGLKPDVLSAIFKASSGNNWSLQVYNPWPGVMENTPASNDYQPGFMVDLMVKDLDLAKAVAAEASVDNAMGRLALETFSEHQAAGNGKRDFSSVLERIKPSNG